MSCTPMPADLRDTEFWRRWVKKLPVAERAILQQAAVQYVSHEDTLLMVFTNSSLGSLDGENCSRVVDQIKAFYDVQLQRWIATQAEGSDKPPLSAVMPKVVIEVAPPTGKSH